MIEGNNFKSNSGSLPQKWEKSQIKVKLQKINRTRYFEQVVEQIRNLIENGDVAVGQRLPTITNLSEQLNTGRSSIREALRVLETEGLIEVRQGSGTFVMPRSEWAISRTDAIGWLRQRGESIIQLLQVREWLEGLSVSLVAMNPTPEVIRELESILDEITSLVNDSQVKGSEPDYDSISELNTRFHLTISEHSGNQIVHEFLSEILPAFSESNKAVLFAKPTLEQQSIEHRNILNALKDHDPERAVRQIRDHVIRVRSEIQNLSDDS